MALTLGPASSNRVYIAHSASMAGLAVFSFLIWVYPTSLNANRRLAAKRDSGGNNGPEFGRLTGTGNAYIRTQSSRATQPMIAISNTLPLTTNAWYCVAVVHDTVGDDAHIYIGDLSTELTEPGYATYQIGAGAVQDTGNDLYIGNTVNIDNSWQGRIGLVAIWNANLTLPQLRAQQFNLSRPVSPADNFLFMNLGMEGVSAIDWSGNQNNGTPTGATLAPGVPISLFPYEVYDIEPAAGSVSVTPSPAVAIAVVVNPTVSISGLQITPTPAAAVCGNVDPGVSFGSVSITPAVADAVASRVNPAVVQGSLSLTPTSAHAVSASFDPTVQYGSLGITPGPATAVSATVSPTVGLGSMSVTPVQAFSVVSAQVGSIEAGGGLEITPGDAYLVTGNVDPTVELGSISVTAAAAGLIALTVDPRVRLSSLTTNQDIFVMLAQLLREEP